MTKNTYSMKFGNQTNEYSCQVDSLPWGRKSMVVAQIYDSLVACGGATSAGPTKQCFRFKEVNRKWQFIINMTERRTGAGDIKVNETHWWITGGGGKTSLLNSTEIYNHETKSTTMSSNLPVRIAYHSLWYLNGTHVIMCGGNRNEVFLWNSINLGVTT